MVEVLVGGEDAVAGVQHAGAGRGVGQGGGGEQRGAFLAGRLPVPADQSLAQLPQGGGPDLAVGVHLVADDVVPEIAVVQRAAGVAVVADAAGGVAGDVDPLDRLGLQARVEQVVERVPVAPALPHRAGLLAAERPAAADHAVGHAVGVLVLDDAEVVVAVHARREERAGDGLPQEHVGDAGQAVRRGAEVGVVERRRAGLDAGLDVALDSVGAGPAAPEVVVLEVARRLGEAVAVVLVVDSVVLVEEVRGGLCHVLRVAVRGAVGQPPVVQEREQEPSGGRVRAERVWLGAGPLPVLVVVHVVALGGEQPVDRRVQPAARGGGGVARQRHGHLAGGGGGTGVVRERQRRRAARPGRRDGHGCLPAGRRGGAHGAAVRGTAAGVVGGQRLAVEDRAGHRVHRDVGHVTGRGREDHFVRWADAAGGGERRHPGVLRRPERATGETRPLSGPAGEGRAVGGGRRGAVGHHRHRGGDRQARPGSEGGRGPRAAGEAEDAAVPGDGHVQAAAEDRFEPPEDLGEGDDVGPAGGVDVVA